jgi:putative protein-disulfide isomerase
MTARLVYGFDPLCGWCYGFAPALRALRAALPELAIDLRMGGLVTGDRIGPYADAAAYVAGASARMTAVTGVALGPAFHARILHDPAVVASSVPPCDALVQVRAVAPESAPDMAEALQIAHFRDGRDLNDASVYADIADALGIAATFDLPGPRDVRPALAREFAAGRALGLTSFPSLLLAAGGQTRRIEVAYDPKRLVDTVRGTMADNGSGPSV